jgi:hypothetical protein
MPVPGKVVTPGPFGIVVHAPSTSNAMMDENRLEYFTRGIINPQAAALPAATHSDTH